MILFCPMLWVLPRSSCWGSSRWIALTMVVGGPAPTPAGCRAKKESWRCPSQFWLCLACCPHSNSSTPSEQIVPFLEKVMVVSSSHVVHTAPWLTMPAWSVPVWAANSPGRGSKLWWVQVACEAPVRPVASRISPTCWPGCPSRCLLGTPFAHLQVHVLILWHKLLFCTCKLCSSPLGGGAGCFAVTWPPPPPWICWYSRAKLSSVA